MPGNWKKKTFVQTIFESSIIIIIKNMFIMKNLTDFRKTVETGVDQPSLLNPNTPLKQKPATTEALWTS